MLISPVLLLAFTVLTSCVYGSAITRRSSSHRSSPWLEPRQSFCLTDDDATTVAGYFVDLIADYSTSLANAVLADDYTDQADSVNTLIDNGGTSPIPLGSLTFASKAAFEAGQGAQPAIPFTILNQWHTCDTVIIRWVSAQTPQQVQGFDAIIVEPATNSSSNVTYQIKTVYGEFNSGAWLANLGHPECS